jgi:uncharacterized protein DUF3187
LRGREPGSAGSRLLVGLVLECLVALPLGAQGLPTLHALNPAVESRSGLYFQPYLQPKAGWRTEFAFDYGSMVELGLRFTAADTSYLLDAEAYRLSLAVSRDLGPNDFLLGDLSLGGAFAGGLDGFLNWYHDLLGIDFPEREGRPSNVFDYYYRYADGTRVQVSSSNLFLNDLRLGGGHRFDRHVQSVLSLTLPTATGPSGYGRGTVSVNLLNTARFPISSRLIYEGQLGVGYTPTHGPLESIQNQTFLALSSGMRYRFWGGSSLFANLYWETAYYHDTDAEALDGQQLSIDFGWIYRTKSGREWRLGMTEDPWPSGPAIDLVFRAGMSW